MSKCSVATECDAASVAVRGQLELWAKQIGPECSWDVKVLSCVKKARRLRGEHNKSCATSQAPQAPCNGMLETVARWLRQRSSLVYAWWT